MVEQTQNESEAVPFMTIEDFAKVLDPVVQPPGLQECIVDTHAALTRARVTKLEVYIMKILLSQSDDIVKGKQLDKYILIFSTDTRQLWTDHVHPDIIALAKPLYDNFKSSETTATAA